MVQVVECCREEVGDLRGGECRILHIGVRGGAVPVGVNGM